MIHPYFSIGTHSNAERRLLFQHGPEDFYANMRPELSGNPNEHRELIKRNPEAQPLFDAMHDFAGEKLTIENLEDYINGRLEEADTKPLNSFELDLQRRLEQRSTASDVKEKLHAERGLNNLLDYITKYNKAMNDSARKRADLRQQEKLPPGIDTVKSAVTGTLSAHWEGFKNANNQDKAVMLAGVIVSVIVLKKLWDGIAAQKKGAGAFLKNTLGLAIGGGALYLAYEAANRNAKIVTKGKVDHPFSRVVSVNPDVPGIVPGVEFHSPLLTDDALYEQELDRITDELRKKGMPPAFIDSMLTIGGKQEKKFMAGLAVMSSLRVEEAQELYEKYKHIREIPDGELPSSPALRGQKDKDKQLDATERFALLEEMGTAMGLIRNGEFHLPDDPSRQNKTLLYLIATGVDIK